MRNVGCTLYLALYLSSFHWMNTKDTCITVCSWYFYAYDVTLYHVFRCRFPVQMPQLAVRNKRRWFSVTWPATASLRVCVPHAVALWFSFSQRTHTLSLFFVPSLHGVYCSTLEIKPPGGIAAKHRCGMHQVHWLGGGVLQEGVWRTFRTRTPIRADKLASSLC